MSHVCLSGHLAGRLAWQKALTLDITCKWFDQIKFVLIPGLLISIIDLYHFILLALIVTLAEGHNVSAKQKLLASFSPIHFV